MRCLCCWSNACILLASSALGQSGSGVNLGWAPSPDPRVAGYNLYFGVASQTYTNMVAAGNATNATVMGLAPGVTYFFSVIAVDPLGEESPFSNEVTYTVPAGGALATSNAPPTISSVPDQVISANGSTPALSFSVGDEETPAAQLTVSAASANPVLVPNDNITLSGGGTNWSIQVVPVLGQTGTVTIALTVCDPSLCTTTSFQVTVNPLPTISLTSPESGGSFLAPALVSLGARVAANGHIIKKVQFFNGSALLGETTTAPYTLNWNGLGAGSYSFAAAAIYDVASTVISTPVGISVAVAPGLPAPWQTVDIGTLALTGSAAISNGLYTVQGAGSISSSSDNFRFLYQSLSGDGEIAMQVESLQNTRANALSGVMIRESLTSGSKYALVAASPNGAVRWQRRSSTGAGTSSTKGGNCVMPNIWLRVVRKGNTLYGYKSTNGASWTLVNSSVISMAANIYIGLAVASGTTTTMSSSVCANLTVIP